MTSLKLNQNWRGLSSLFGSETFTYVFKRLLQALLTLFLASALCFAIIELAPGNYLDTLSQNPKISPETLKQLEQQFGLDKPAIVQYWRWLQQIVTRGNFRRRQSKPHSRSSSTSSQLHRTGISELYHSVAAAIFRTKYFASFPRRRNDKYRPRRLALVGSNP